jgi:putative NADPH-quinone reductase
VAHRILVVDGHPDPDAARFSHAIADAYTEGARAAGRTAYVARIAALDFSYVQSASQFSLPCPHIGIKEVQAHLADADHIVLVYPLWLGTMPALLRTFLEEVATGGFATCNDGKRWTPNLRGKSGHLIVTMDARALIGRWFVRAPDVFGVECPVLRFLGVSPVRVTLFGRARDPRLRERRLRTARRLGARGA